MTIGAVYCGAPPIPGGLMERFNLDPVLIVALAAVAAVHIRASRRLERGHSLRALRLGAKQTLAQGRDDGAGSGLPVRSSAAAAGWAVAAAALISPLCALSVSLFSARVAQHMILLLVAAPLIASALPEWSALRRAAALWGASVAFFVALWFWHMPAPYEATFRLASLYWLMHLSLFGSGVALWATLLRQHSPQALAAGTLASVQMGLLGAVITLASWPMYRPHYATTEAWGFTPLADQQLGGVLMWVPGCLLFLWIALRSLALMWRAIEEASA